MKKSAKIAIVIVVIILFINATWRSFVPGEWREATVLGWTVDHGDGFALVSVKTEDGEEWTYRCFDTEDLHVDNVIELKFTKNNHIINDRW